MYNTSNLKFLIRTIYLAIIAINAKHRDSHRIWGVLVLLQLYWAPDIVEFVLGRFSHFNIAIAYSNSTFCGAWTPSFCEFTQIFSKTSTPRIQLFNMSNLFPLEIIRNVNFVYYRKNSFR